MCCQKFSSPIKFWLNLRFYFLSRILLQAFKRLGVDNLRPTKSLDASTRPKILSIDKHNFLDELVTADLTPHNI